MKFQNVTTSIPAPNTTSDANVNTVVKRFPIEVMMGPHTPKRICPKHSIRFYRTDGGPGDYHESGIEYNTGQCDT